MRLGLVDPVSPPLLPCKLSQSSLLLKLAIMQAALQNCQTPRCLARHQHLNLCNLHHRTAVHALPQGTHHIKQLHCSIGCDDQQLDHGDKKQIPADLSVLQRRNVLLATAAMVAIPTAARAESMASPSSSESKQLDTSITNLVYLDIGIAPRSFKTAGERTLGDKTVIPLEDAEPTGRIVLGLYGNVAPGTVANFLRLVRSGALDGTVFSKVLPGEYIQAGQQGAYRMGQVEADKADLQSNPDLLSPDAYRLPHYRPGTLSLSLAENDEDPAQRNQLNYRSTEFLITTGPGPVPRLDSANLVFGRVTEGMSVVSTIAQVPTFKPSERSKQLNVFAQSLGDDRAATVRRKYGKPLKAVIITKAGELPLPAVVPVTTPTSGQTIAVPSN